MQDVASLLVVHDRDVAMARLVRLLVETAFENLVQCTSLQASLHGLAALCVISANSTTELKHVASLVHVDNHSFYEECNVWG